MSLSYWRNLAFFDIKEVRENTVASRYALQDAQVLCWASGRGQLVFGDHEGVVKMYDRSFNCTQFKAYNGIVSHVYQVKQMKCLLTVGDDNDNESFKLKIWSLDHENEQPSLHRVVRLFNEGYPPPAPQRLPLNCNTSLDLDYRTRDSQDKVPQSSFTSPVTYIDVSEDLQYTVVGLTNGQIILIRGHLLRGGAPKQSILRRQYHTGKPTPITYLAFRRDRETKKEGCFVLYAVYNDGANLWRVNPKGEMCEPATEMCGCEHGRACVSDDGRLLLAERDTLNFFGGPEMKDTEKAGSKTPTPSSVTKRIGWFKNYMWAIATNGDKDQLTIYDFTNKLKATTFNQCKYPNVICVLCEWSCIYVLYQENPQQSNNLVDQRLVQLEEKDTQTKLELIFKKDMYPVAIELAKSQQFDEAATTEIYKKYGDSLYQKTEYSGAVDQYIKTIGNLEPSYVIRKFLDAQQILNLTRYLEELHTRRYAGKKPLANEDHTTLLLNCYTKLKDKKKLDEFIAEDREYNPETAIKVLRQAAYYDHALHLANKFKVHGSYLSIQIEDKKDYDAALNYIHSLDFESAQEQLKEYGKVLVSKNPAQAANLLMEICTGWKRQTHGLPVEPGTVGGGESMKASPDQFLPCFVDRPRYLMKFLEIVKNDLSYQSDQRKSTMVYDTLLELYLTKSLGREPTSSDDDIDDDYEERKEKALALLRDNKDKYNREHALVLVQTHSFREGILFLYESLKLYQDILQYYMEINDKDEVIRTCESFGKHDPNMWVQVLLYFVGLTETEDVSLEIQKVLKHIDDENLLPPLVVIDILAKSKQTQLDTIKSYVIKRLEKDMEAIEQDQAEIRELQGLTHKYREEIKSQQSQAQIISNTACKSCGKFELPVVHFMCKHSYCQGCLAENDKCSHCSQGFSRILDVNKQLEESVENHEVFFRRLQPGKDGFSVVAEYFGRSIFNGEYPPPPEHGR
eukprot:TRINITY_DN5693_c0_g2_i1.p1 TRINITY_DN5693_c0_g2~~TRINITY_DN5693_c0_g2_i1.p1  ORF type:complete len:987 (+),score=409.86 TRINITY_DN5693_c0_g2_i1:69-2963(+)